MTAIINKSKPVVVALAISGLLVVCLLVFDNPPMPQSISWTNTGRDTSLLPTDIAAPEFTLPTARGKEIRLADLKGKQVGLVFVTAACPYCNKLEEQLKTLSFSQDRQLLIICRGGKTDAQKIEQTHVLAFPVLVDSTGVIHQAYKVAGVPLVYIVDEEGKIMAGTTGMPGAWEMIEKFQVKGET